MLLCKKKISFQKGQATVESMLLITVLVGFSLTVFLFFKDKEVMSEFTNVPASYIKGMATYGVWSKSQNRNIKHPSLPTRHIMSKPEE